MNRTGAWLIAATLALPAAAGGQSDALPPAVLARVIEAAVQAAVPATVRIDTIGGVAPGRADAALPQPAGGPATGVVWSSDGLLVTSLYPFLREPALTTVRTADGRRHVARLIGQDHVARLALLRIDAAGLALPAHCPPAERRVGRWAVALGYGHGGAAPAVSVGIISAQDRIGGLAVQTDARISPVHYGGPLIDVEGRLIGVCVPLAPQPDLLAGTEWYDSGIGFAIPPEIVAQRVQRMLRQKVLRPAALGAALRDAAQTAEGPVVHALADGPAAQAGLRPGDVLLAIDGQPVPDVCRLRRLLMQRCAGDEVQLDYRRGGVCRRVRLTLADPRALSAGADAAPAGGLRPAAPRR